MRDSLQKHHLTLLAIGAFCLPIKLSFTYICFIPIIILWILQEKFKFQTTLVEAGRLLAPLFFYFLYLIIAACFGLNPLKSVPNALCALFMALLVPVAASSGSAHAARTVLLCYLAGQTVAGVHTLVDSFLPESINNFFVGAVTESGQLALAIPILFGLIAQLNVQITYRDLKQIKKVLSLKDAIMHLLAKDRWLYLLAFPVLISALIINLKRGPWAGVLVSIVVYFLIHKPRAILPVIVLAALLAATVTPIRDRILSAPEHFFISGGRSEIWDIGAELITTYPLGIGFRNSPILRQFSEAIPENLRHFHSNPINLLVESGVIGFLIFYWWIYLVLKEAFCFSHRKILNPLITALGCSVLSWQVAGIVEYNIGDSEVLFVAYLMIGCLIAITSSQKQTDL